MTEEEEMAADAVMIADLQIIAACGSSYYSSAVADVATASDTVATVVAEAVMTTVSGLFFCLSAVVDAATEMTAVVDVDANPEILTPDCHKLYQFYILNSYKASVRI